MSISRITTPPPILPLAPLFPGVKAGQTGQFFQSRLSDLQDLGQSLQSGNLTGAEQDFNSIQSLAQTGPFNGKAFGVNQREQDFSAIGQALQSGDISGAKQDFAKLESTFSDGRILDPSGTTGASSVFSTAETSALSGTAAPPLDLYINLGNTASAASSSSADSGVNVVA
jgi:hypothetical protein